MEGFLWESGGPGSTIFGAASTTGVNCVWARDRRLLMRPVVLGSIFGIFMLDVTWESAAESAGRLGIASGILTSG